MGQVTDRSGNEAMPPSSLQLSRLEITDGFVMPGFEGRFFMWPEEYWLLSKYVDIAQGDYLEVGSMCGIIAMSFAEKYRQRRFVCVDKFSGGYATIAGEKEIFYRNLQAHGLKNVTLIEGDSLSVVPGLSQPFEVVFIDADHSYDHVINDAVNSWSLLSPGGFIAFHDYGYVEDTTRAVGQFLKQMGGCFLESASGLAVIQKPDVRENMHPVRVGLQQYIRAQRLSETASLQETIKKLEDDIDWLLNSIKEHEERARQAESKGTLQALQAEKRALEARAMQLEAVLKGVEKSVSYRVTAPLRRLRDWVAPDASFRRKLYSRTLRMFGRGK
jgi:precorrin-6B methylase 2